MHALACLLAVLLAAVPTPAVAVAPAAVVAGAPPAVAPAAPLAGASRLAVPPDAGVPAAPVVPAESSFGWPLDGSARVVRRFDPPPSPWLAGHRGVDLAAPPGAPVRAAGAGVVLFAGRIAGRGVVSVAHANGLRTTYEPVEPTARTGDPVRAGDRIGVLAAGHPGCPEPACLHWGLRRGDEYLDPLALLGLGRVRLLPLARGQ